MEELLVKIAIGLLTIIVSVASALIKGAFSAVHARIDEIKADALRSVEAEERRRNEAINNVHTDVNAKFSEIKTDLRGIREEIRHINQQ